MDATLHLIAKHSWRVLEPLRFLNTLVSLQLNVSALCFAARCRRTLQGRSATTRAHKACAIQIRHVNVESNA